MNKRIATIGLIILAIVVIATPVFFAHAADPAPATPTTADLNLKGNDIKLDNPLGNNATIPSLLARIFSQISTVLYAVVPIFIVIGAFQMMFAQGNPENFKKGQKTILYSVIGLVIILMANGIVAIVKSILKG